MKQPPCCNDQVWGIALRCWDQNTEARGEFNEIKVVQNFCFDFWLIALPFSHLSEARGELNEIKVVVVQL